MPETLQPTTLSAAEEQEPSHVRPGASDQTRIDIAPLAGFFNVQEPDIDQEDQMRYIARFFELRQITDWALVLMNLRNMEGQLGLGDPTQSRLSKLYQYIKTQNHVAMLSAELESMKQ